MSQRRSFQDPLIPLFVPALTKGGKKGGGEVGGEGEGEEKGGAPFVHSFVSSPPPSH